MAVDFATCVHKGLRRQDKTIPCNKMGGCEHKATPLTIQATPICTYKGKATTKPCKACGYIIPIDAEKCSYCGDK